MYDGRQFLGRLEITEKGRRRRKIKAVDASEKRVGTFRDEAPAWAAIDSRARKLSRERS
jgi:hypothetical protein